MMEIVSNKNEDEVIDCAFVGNNNENPITYADIDRDFQGNIIPSETVLTDEEDHKTT